MENELKLEKLESKHNFQMEEVGRLDLMKNEKKKEIAQLTAQVNEIENELKKKNKVLE